jgi:hypothetical protein
MPSTAVQGARLVVVDETNPPEHGGDDRIGRRLHQVTLGDNDSAAAGGSADSAKR